LATNLGKLVKAAIQSIAVDCKGNSLGHGSAVTDNIALTTALDTRNASAQAVWLLKWHLSADHYSLFTQFWRNRTRLEQPVAPKIANSTENLR
jgi:hypothetical protein